MTRAGLSAADTWIAIAEVAAQLEPATIALGLYIMYIYISHVVPLTMSTYLGAVFQYAFSILVDGVHLVILS